jgi:UV DNA damage endonuclease
MSKKRAGASIDAPVFFAAESQPRWGLCCQFIDSPIKFRQATHRYVSTLGEAERIRYLSEIVRANGETLAAAILKCAGLGIGAFRITSQIMPLATHPVSGFRIDQLENSDAITDTYVEARNLASKNGIRLSFHPDQFVVLNSLTERVVSTSVREMNHHAMVAELIGAEALTLHVGGKVEGTERALSRLERGIDMLNPTARRMLALENDDRLFSPANLLPFCERAGIPFIYDVHHHRCNPDSMPVTEATQRAIATWSGREPWMHISSPRDGWSAKDPRPHAGYIDPADFPEEWLGVTMTVDVEAKEKERAVIAIKQAIRERVA